MHISYPEEYFYSLSLFQMSVEIQNTVQDICEDMQLQLCKLGLALYGGPIKDELNNGEMKDEV